MRLLFKSILCAAILLFSIAIAPAAKADGITISAAGFSLHNLGNNGRGIPGLDSLTGQSAFTSTNPALGDHTSEFLLNLLTFNTGFTGDGSRGPHSFNFSQEITVNGALTQTLQIAGRIDIGQAVDSVHILSSNLLTFQFSTFSVDLKVLPVDIDGFGPGCFSGQLLGEYTIRTNNSPVPEPATLSLLGLGLAGVAAKLRKRRKSRNA
jgi:PEP-CTERM motif